MRGGGEVESELWICLSTNLMLAMQRQFFIGCMYDYSTFQAWYPSI